MYTKENGEKRKGLKTYGIVRAAIEEFMAIFNPTSSGNVSKEDYMKQYSIILTSLRPGIDADESQTILAADWDSDSADKPPDFENILDENKRDQARKEYEAQG